MKIYFPPEVAIKSSSSSHGACGMHVHPMGVWLAPAQVGQDVFLPDLPRQALNGGYCWPG
jgi:hypothetical protein